MPYDGLVLKAVLNELEREVKGCSVDRVHQPAREVLVIHLRRARETKRLLLSARATTPGIYLIDSAPANPSTPPVFCQVLRKHLEAGRMVAIEQPGLERLARFWFETKDELGRKAILVLLVEVMGKHSNIILVNPETGLILDAVKRYDFSLNRYREVLPGKPYREPPPQEKLNPCKATEEDFFSALLGGDLTRPFKEAMRDTISGFSLDSAAEALFRGGLEPDTPVENCGILEFSLAWQGLQKVVALVTGDNPKGVLACKSSPGRKADNPVCDFAPFSLLDPEVLNQKNLGSISEAVARCYYLWETQEQLNRQKRVLTRQVEKARKRTREKIKVRQEELRQAGEADTLRLAGETIMANLHGLTKGVPVLAVPDSRQPDKTMTIKLRPELTPVENASDYFHRYNKARKCSQETSRLLSQAQAEQAYLDTLLDSLDRVINLEDLAEIEAEVLESGLAGLRQASSPASVRADKKMLAGQPLQFISSDGFTILVGKNNRQNDRLSLRMAKPGDTWLHVKKAPGAHVLIRMEGKAVPPSRKTLEEAALLAAYYSSQRSSSKVEVDCTSARHVHKPPGSPPGYVLYDNQQTLLVNPAQCSLPRSRS